MFDYENFGNSSEDMDLVARYEKMLESGKMSFFDVDDFETIVDHYIAVEEFKKAQDACVYGLNQHPTSAQLMIQKAELCLAFDQNDMAVELLKNAESINPFARDVKVALGALYARIQEHEESVKYYEQAIKLGVGEGEEDIYADIAYEYQQVQDWPKAVEYLKMAIQFDKENDSLMFELGLCFNNLKQVDESIIYFNDFLNDHPYSYIAWFNLGNAYLRKEEYKKALFSFDYAVVTNDLFPAAYYGKANAYIMLEQYEDAIKVFGETFVLEQPHAYVYCNIGECYEKIGKYDEALTYYEKSLELDPDQTDAWVGIGVVKDLMKDPSQGIKFMEKALEKEPNNVDFLYLYAEMLEKVGQTEKSSEVFRKVVEMEPDNLDAWLDYAGVVYKEKQDEAVKVLRNAMQFHEDDNDLKYQLAAYLYSIGENESASQNLRKALAKDYDGHKKLFDFYPEAQNITEIVDIIADYKRTE